MDCAGVCLNDADADSVCDRWKCQVHASNGNYAPTQRMKMAEV